MPTKRNSREKRQQRSRARAAEHYMFRGGLRRVAQRDPDDQALVEREQIFVRVDFINEVQPVADNHETEQLADLDDQLSDVSSGDFDEEDLVATEESRVSTPQPPTPEVAAELPAVEDLTRVPPYDQPEPQHYVDPSENEVDETDEPDVLEIGGDAEIYDYEP